MSIPESHCVLWRRTAAPAWPRSSASWRLPPPPTSLWWRWRVGGGKVEGATGVTRDESHLRHSGGAAVVTLVGGCAPLHRGFNENGCWASGMVAGQHGDGHSVLMGRHSMNSFVTPCIDGPPPPSLCAMAPPLSQAATTSCCWAPRPRSARASWWDGSRSAPPHAHACERPPHAGPRRWAGVLCVGGEAHGCLVTWRVCGGVCGGGCGAEPFSGVTELHVNCGTQCKEVWVRVHNIAWVTNLGGWETGDDCHGLCCGALVSKP